MDRCSDTRWAWSTCNGTCTHSRGYDSKFLSPWSPHSFALRLYERGVEYVSSTIKQDTKAMTWQHLCDKSRELRKGRKGLGPVVRYAVTRAR